MTNNYVTWAELKSRVTVDNKLYWHKNDLNYQLYTLEGANTFIRYIARPDLFSIMVIDSATQNQYQADYDDFDVNYKPAGIETNGVKD